MRPVAVRPVHVIPSGLVITPEVPARAAMNQEPDQATDHTVVELATIPLGIQTAPSTLVAIVFVPDPPTTQIEPFQTPPLAEVVNTAAV